MPLARPQDRPLNLPRSSRTKPTHVLRTPSASILPLQLQDKVPPCAQQCLAAHINQGYNNCPNDGIVCLCDSYTSQGFALGELAYLCLSQSCGEPTRQQLLAQYNICSDVPGAVVATHTILTASAARPAKSSGLASTRKDSSSTRRPSSSSTRSPVVTSSTTAAATGAHSVGSVPTTDSSTTRGDTASSGKPAAAPDSASAITNSNRSNTSEIVGIAVGVFAFVVLVAAAMYFFCCFRRRKDDESGSDTSGFLSRFRRRRSSQQVSEKSYDFVDRGPPRLSPLLYVKPASEIQITDRDTIGCWQQLASSPAKQHQRTLDVPPQGIKRDDRSQTATPPVPQISSGQSIQRTPSAQSNRINVNETVEERRTPSPQWNGIGLPPNPKAGQHSPKPIPPSRQPSPLSTDRTLNAPPTRDWPLTSKDSSVAKPALLSPPPPAILILPPQPPADLNYPEPPLSAVSQARSRDSSGSLLNYYASSAAGIVSSPVVMETPRNLENEKPTRPAIKSKKRLSKTRDRLPRSRKDSEDSDTSFESSEEDLPAAPDASDLHLSPSPESTPPMRRSPIAGMRYPAIPKSASQSVYRPSYQRAPQTFPQSPRTPKAWHETTDTQREDAPHQYSQQSLPVARIPAVDRRASEQSILSGSTLVEKRRGRKKAHGMELYLEEDDSAYTPFKQTDHVTEFELYNSKGQPTKARYYAAPTQYGQNVRPDRHQSSRHHSRGQNLTPERKGDDLYLPFGVASPMQSEFR